MGKKLVKYKTIIFGEYHGQPIEWYIIDTAPQKELIISKYGLDSVIYSKDKCKSWSESDLRQWCKQFYSEAFSTTQRMMIEDTVLTDGDNLCIDKLYVLSLSEAKLYFENAEEKEVQATDYALTRGVFKGKRGNCRWWLRSEDNITVFAAGASPNNEFNYVEVEVDNSFPAVRPTCWIKTE